jgi:hypothetical protein
VSSTPAAQRLLDLCGPVAEWDEAAGSPLLSWLEGPGQILQVLDDLVRDQPATDGDGALLPSPSLFPSPSLLPSGGDAGAPPAPGWSVILDINRCPTYALPWLGQLVGVRLAPTLPDAVMRQTIDGEQNFGRGTLAAMHAAAAPFLIDGGAITIIERTPDPYSFSVTVPSADLLDPSWSELAATYPTWSALAGAFAVWNDIGSTPEALEAALLAAKPAGLVMSLTVV